VNWPTWDELKSSTTVVLVFSIFVTLFIALVDMGVGTLVKKLIEWM
jgi:preprotein translocase subunit SecE